MILAAGFYFFGMCIGILVGIEYIPHQIKKKNQKIIKKVQKLLEENKN